MCAEYYCYCMWSVIIVKAADWLLEPINNSAYIICIRTVYWIYKINLYRLTQLSFKLGVWLLKLRDSRFIIQDCYCWLNIYLDWDLSVFIYLHQAFCQNSRSTVALAVGIVLWNVSSGPFFVNVGLFFCAIISSCNPKSWMFRWTEDCKGAREGNDDVTEISVCCCCNRLWSQFCFQNEKETRGLLILTQTQ